MDVSIAKDVQNSNKIKYYVALQNFNMLYPFILLHKFNGAGKR